MEGGTCENLFWKYKAFIINSLIVDKLTINYNRSRQASITKELIEIISGAESL